MHLSSRQLSTTGKVRTIEGSTRIDNQECESAIAKGLFNILICLDQTAHLD